MGLGGAIGEAGSFPGKDEDGHRRKLWVISLKNSLEFQETALGEMACKVAKHFLCPWRPPKLGTKRTISLFMKRMCQEQLCLSVGFVDCATDSMCVVPPTPVTPNRVASGGGASGGD